MHIFWASVFLIPKIVMKEIEIFLKGFLWSGGELGKGQAKVAWKEVCMPKDCGGLGLKSLQKWNEVLLTKHIWNVCNKQDTLWVKWICTERLKGKSIWIAKDTMQSSWSWRGILKQRDMMKNHCISKIGNGNKTILLHDLLCPMSPLSNYINEGMLQDANIKDNVTVGEMVQERRWKWPATWVNKIPALGRIQVPHLRRDKEDKIVWLNNSGNEVEFNMRNVRKDIRGNGIKVSWSKVVWFSQCIPSHAFLLWLAMRDRLQTQDRLMKWYPTKTYLCTLCEKQHDSLDHLFFKCEYSEYIWDEMKEVMDDNGAPNTWQSIKQWFSNKQSNNTVASVIQRISLAACVYMVWKDINARIFNKKPTPN